MLACMFLAQALTPLSSATLNIFSQRTAIFLLIFGYICRYYQGSCVECILEHADNINIFFLAIVCHFVL